MKVYVFTKYALFGAEGIMFVSKTKKAGEKELRNRFPFFRPSSDSSYVLDKKKNILGSVHELEVIE